ncbi:uncharacterized protein ARMOST_01137 [Armillaria ostoyae]|uniref:Uncharacterized protein n=1 Tax=Armillaria ostoyae TaxID=47428 RepID=A0A284QN52_ARMOS|nr:uncharacterized protein ARMOST_01137 [Armillaria ostoyae]
MSRGGTDFPDIDQAAQALRYVNRVVCHSRRVYCWHPQFGVFRVYLSLDVLPRFWCRGRLAKYLPYPTWMSPARLGSRGEVAEDSVCDNQSFTVLRVMEISLR